MAFDYVQMAREKKFARAKALPVPDEMLGLPERLTRAMDARELDQPKLARAAGVSQGTISKLVNGESLAGVTAAVIARISKALEVPSGWLLTAEGDVIPRLRARAAGDGPVVEFVEGRDRLVPPPSLPPASAEPASQSR